MADENVPTPYRPGSERKRKKQGAVDREQVANDKNVAMFRKTKRYPRRRYWRREKSACRIAWDQTLSRFGDQRTDPRSPTGSIELLDSFRAWSQRILRARRARSNMPMGRGPPV